MKNWSKRLITSSTLLLLGLLAPVFAAAQTVGLCSLPPTCLAGSVGHESTYVTAARVRRLSYKGEGLERILEHELNSRDFYDSSEKMRITLLLTQLKEAARTLHSRYEIGATVVENSRSEARNLFRLSDEVDNLIHEMPLSRPTLKSWSVMRQEISLLALVYNESACMRLYSEPEIGAPREYQSAASSYSRIWLFEFN
jgi:hypothetical protein